MLEKDAVAGERIDDLTREVLAVSGPGHWATGSRGSAHVTVTALEGRRCEVSADDAHALAYGTATRSAAARCGPVRLAFTGVTFTSGSVMLAARSVDGSADAPGPLCGKA